MLHRVVENYWHVVAGVVEEDETFAEAAARELREETGLDAAVIDVRMRQSYRVPDDMRAEYLAGIDEVVIENYTIEVPPGWEPELNDEHDDYRWLNAADAITIAHWAETREVIAFLARSGDSVEAQEHAKPRPAQP